ncbi:type VII secretion-associated serine protease mycosin [Phytomonospora sp. NPDC050363]|uniref:type VII secretion-associated serine protease mycosin n=1 Tax=Phytomonospora sp. NPDC050363 TaxID=3155642 RepID=UPI0033EA51C7
MPSLLRRIGATGTALLAAAAVIALAPPAARAAGCEAFSSTEAYKDPWPLLRLAPERVYPLTMGEGVLVAVVDSGVGEHPALKGRLEGGADFVTRDALPWNCDLASHGTLIAGVIAGRLDHETLFHGIAPEARILPIRVWGDKSTSGSDADTLPIAQGIREAVDRKAKVINLSLTARRTGELDKAIAYAAEHDVVVVTAAGNTASKPGEKIYPAAYALEHASVIAVAGTDRQGAHVSSSTAGEWVGIAAPGVEIVGPAPAGGGYGQDPNGGTSYAAPYVAGTAALLRAYYPDLSAEDVVARMKATANHPPGGRNDLVGHGEVDPYRAITAPLTPSDGVAAPRVDQPVPPVDEFAAVKDAALLVAAVGLVAVIVLAVARFAVPRGRRRGWKG